MPFFQPPGPLQDWHPGGSFQALSLFRTAPLAGEELLPDTDHTSLKETTYTARPSSRVGESPAKFPTSSLC